MSLNRPDFTTRTFWANTGERIVRTAAQTAVATWFINGTTPANVDLYDGAKLVGFAALLTLLTALAGKVVGDSQSPSFILGAAPKV